MNKPPVPWEARVDKLRANPDVSLSVEYMREELDAYRKMFIESYQAQFEPKYMLIDGYHHDRTKPNLAQDCSRGHYGPFNTPEEAEAWSREAFPKMWHSMWVQTLHPVASRSIWDDE